MHAEVCSWCGEPIGSDDGYRLGEHAGERRAAFCRLEHIVPWAIQGAHWDAGDIEPQSESASLDRCARCGTELDDARLILVRHRGEFRIADAFCGLPHLMEWAREGGRWR